MSRFALFCLVLATACSRYEPAPLMSPSGVWTAGTEISGSEAGPARRACVRLKINEVQAKREISYQTGASNGQKWAIAWSPAGSLVLYSSDVGIMAYDIKGHQIVERAADRAEEQVGREAYRRKYGKSPRA
jgi:hypothetical protein